MFKDNIHFKIIIPMYNCADYAVDCIESVLKQKYRNWQIIIGLEPSTDLTLKIISNYLLKINDNRIILINNEKRKYAPKNHIDCIKYCKPKNEDVILCVDGDDKLYEDNVLFYLNEVYQDENIWISWGNYCCLDKMGFPGGAATPLPPDVVDIRKDPWRFSHLKTFKYFLWKNIKDIDFRDSVQKEYFSVASDMAIMFPMIEMAGRKHSKFIDKILYIYTNTSPYNDSKLYLQLGQKCKQDLQSRLPYKEKTKEELLSHLSSL